MSNDKKCKPCEGRGHYPEDLANCVTCNGTGTVSNDKSDMPMSNRLPDNICASELGEWVESPVVSRYQFAEIESEEYVRRSLVDELLGYLVDLDETYNPPTADAINNAIAAIKGKQ